MPFREKLKKTFSRNSTSGEGSPTRSKASSRRNSNIYQPGEKIPYKYRRPVAKEHREKLEAFSFASAWRRKSHQSQYSPMGSRMPSRRGSLASAIRKSIGSRRGDSYVGPLGELHESGVSTVSATNEYTVDGLSDSQAENESPDGLTSEDFAQAYSAASTPRHDVPFSQEDLALALKRSHLQIPA